MDNDNTTIVIEETAVVETPAVTDGNVIEDTTCTICNTIDYTEQLDSIYDGIYFLDVFIAIYVSFYIFNYVVNKFVIKKEA